MQTNDTRDKSNSNLYLKVEELSTKYADLENIIKKYFIDAQDEKIKTNRWLKDILYNLDDDNVPGLTIVRKKTLDNGESIATLSLFADETKAEIKAIAEFQKDTTDSIAKITQTATEQGAKIESVAERTTKTESDIEGLNDDVSELGGKVTTITESVAKIEQEATNDRAAVTLLAERTTKTESDIKGLDGKVTEGLSEISLKVDKNEAAITSISEWQTDTSESIANIEQKAKTNEASIKQITDWKGSITDNNGELKVVNSLATFEQHVSDTYAKTETLSQYSTKDETGKAISDARSSIETEAANTYATLSMLSEYSTKDDVTGAVSEAKAEIKETADNLGAQITAEVTRATQAESGLSDGINTLNDGFARIAASVDNNSASITDIVTWKEGTSTNIAEIERKVTNNTSEINLRAIKTDVDTELAAISLRVDEQNKSIIKLEADILEIDVSDKVTVGDSIVVANNGTITIKDSNLESYPTMYDCEIDVYGITFDQNTAILENTYSSYYAATGFSLYRNGQIYISADERGFSSNNIKATDAYIDNISVTNSIQIDNTLSSGVYERGNFGSRSIGFSTNYNTGGQTFSAEYGATGISLNKNDESASINGSTIILASGGTNPHVMYIEAEGVSGANYISTNTLNVSEIVFGMGSFYVENGYVKWRSEV